VVVEMDEFEELEAELNQEFSVDDTEQDTEPTEGQLLVLRMLFGAIAIAFGVAGVIILISVIEDIGWVETDAEITYREETFMTNGDFDYEYTFMVNGDSYNGTDHCFEFESGGYSCKKVHQVGDQVRIGYNPDNPNESEFRMMEYQDGLQFQIILACCAFIPVTLLLVMIIGRIKTGSWGRYRRYPLHQ